jgi:methyl-accepting chemotaxis protein
MSFLARFRIQTKILAVVLILAAAAAIGTWYAGQRMVAIDAAYSRFIDEDVQAWYTTPRLNRAAYQYQALTYRLIAETDDAEMKRLLPEFDKTAAEVVQSAQIIARLSARHADAARQIERMFNDVVNATKSVKELAAANKNVEATAKMRSDVLPVMSKIGVEIVRVRDALDQQIKQGSAALTDDTNATVRTTMIAIGLAILLSLALAVLVARFGVAKPLGAICNVLLELAGGNKSVAIPYAERGDEVGDMARTAQTFRDKLVEMEKLEAEQKEAEERARTDKRAQAEREVADKQAAEQRLAAERRATMHKLADHFEAAVGGIIDTVSAASNELEAAANTLTKTADNTQQLAGTVASASEQASANVQSVASATEELTGSVHEISRQVAQSTTISNEAVQQAQATDARINALSHAAARIGDVVKLITAVAEQTNLLALNATIEAARAGEAGKGFAVVAQEVKALAGQTAKATEEIASQISGMQTETDHAVAAIKQIGGTIRHVSDIAATIAAAVEEQGAATNEIARNIQEASKGTSLVATHIVDVNQGASETGSASSQVLSSAQQLAGESNRLKIEVDKFLATVRAA